MKNLIETNSATLNGHFTRVMVGNWSQPRKLCVNAICIQLQITLRCIDCDRCPERMRFVEARLKQQQIPHFFQDGWVVIGNNSTRTCTWTLIGDEDVEQHTTEPLKYLSKILGLSCVEVEEPKVTAS